MSDTTIITLIAVLGGLLILLAILYIYQNLNNGKRHDPEDRIVQVEKEQENTLVARNNTATTRKPVDYSRYSLTLPPPPVEYPSPSIVLGTRKSLDPRKSTTSQYEGRSSLHLMAHHGESDKVSSTILVQSYTSFINSASLPLRSQITFKVDFSDRDVKKVFEQGKMVKNCFSCLTVGLKDCPDLFSYISNRDRTLTPEEFLEGLDNFSQDWQSLFDFTFRKLKHHWKLSDDLDKKLEVLVDRGIAFLKMYEASDAQMIKTKSAGFDSRVHELVGETGEGKVISLLPGLEREVGEVCKVVYKERLGHRD